jgi:hypothetical protein
VKHFAKWVLIKKIRIREQESESVCDMKPVRTDSFNTVGAHF